MSLILFAILHIACHVSKADGLGENKIVVFCNDNFLIDKSVQLFLLFMMAVNFKLLGTYKLMFLNNAVLPKENRITNLKKQKHSCLKSSIIYNSQNMETMCEYP